MSGNIIKWIAIVNAILSVVLGLGSSSFVLTILGLISSVFIYGFGEIITILGEIRDKTVSNYNNQQEQQLQYESMYKENAYLESIKAVKSLHEQGLDTVSIAKETGMTFAEINDIVIREC